VFLFLLIAFIILYISEKRLKEEHQKLLKAYDLLAENNDALQQAKAQAEESSRMKSNFIKQISHEIRTPLNAVSGFTQIITSPYMDLDSQTKQDLSQKITENTERITRLVSKMLELSEASSKTVLRCDDVATAEQIARQSIANSHISDARHIVFSLKVEPDAGAIQLKTNEHMAARALTQLLDNAQKFAKSGTVVLNIRTDQQQMLFVIEDTGIGIPPEEAEHIFEEFVQLDEYYDGTGIGLSVARSIARRLGGEIVLDTSYTGGARFVFSLPVS
jgi:signal transduction histidine kinase